MSTKKQREQNYDAFCDGPTAIDPKGGSERSTHVLRHLHLLPVFIAGADAGR
jgi:hypothetical protein